MFHARLLCQLHNLINIPSMKENCFISFSVHILHLWTVVKAWPAAPSPQWEGQLGQLGPAQNVSAPVLIRCKYCTACWILLGKLVQPGNGAGAKWQHSDVTGVIFGRGMTSLCGHSASGDLKSYKSEKMGNFASTAEVGQTHLAGIIITEFPNFMTLASRTRPLHCRRRYRGAELRCLTSL